jgi:hypothetical protein
LAILRAAITAATSALGARVLKKASNESALATKSTASATSCAVGEQKTLFKVSHPMMAPINNPMMTPAITSFFPILISPFPLR